MTLLLQVDTEGGAGTQWGTGGMATKLTAARLATAAGCHMAICDAAHPEQLPAIMAGARQGTVFHPHSTPLRRATSCLPPILALVRTATDSQFNKHCMAL